MILHLGELANKLELIKIQNVSPAKNTMEANLSSGFLSLKELCPLLIKNLEKACNSVSSRKIRYPVTKPMQRQVNNWFMNARYTGASTIHTPDGHK
ncbi:hypothetical protein NC651_004669 [Populus alba x Populus x berolinensis]|nr:hypothetical protein NC651_004669 [Populus alba x Populus x berolinensis]